MWLFLERADVLHMAQDNPCRTPYSVTGLSLIRTAVDSEYSIQAQSGLLSGRLAGICTTDNGDHDTRLTQGDPVASKNTNARKWLF